MKKIPSRMEDRTHHHTGNTFLKHYRIYICRRTINLTIHLHLSRDIHSLIIPALRATRTHPY
jgi:hypothetical protein